MKKTIKISLSILLVLACGLFSCVFAFAADKPCVYADSVKAEAGAEIEIPVCIKNNNGIMGTKISVLYDDGLEILDVKRGEVLSTGNFIQNTSLKKDNEFDVVWNSDSVNNLNGVLFIITVRISDDAKGSYGIRFEYDKDNTFDENYNDVELNCENAVITVGNMSFVQIILNFFIKLWNIIVGIFK